MKSVFISSTAKDLGDHRAAVKAAIERLDLRPIDMRNFGSQHGGAVGVSVREVGKADIFVGILAQRYGYVPEGMTKSVTEQEYDEAVRRRLPRLMYLLDANFAWDASLIENDPLAQQRLKAFKDRVNANEVRSLFTTPDNLARQVTADLTKLLDKQRQQTVITRLLAAVLLVIGIIALVLLADPGIRDQAFKIVGIASPTLTPSATPTATFTPSQTPTPTNTPLPTATPLEGTPFANDEVGIVFTDFTVIDSNAPRTESNIERELENEGVTFIHVHHTLSDRAQAQQIAQLYNATIVIWGEIALGGVALNFEINAPPECVPTSIEGLEVSASQLDNFEAYIFEGMDILYVVKFIRGQVAYFNGDYAAALSDFDSAVERLPVGREAEAQAAALFFYRGFVHQQNDNDDEALNDYTQTIELDPSYAFAYNNRGLIYYVQNMPEQALEDYNRAIELDPSYALAYNNRGLIYYDRQMYDEALTDYNRAINLDPQLVLAYNNRGRVYYDQQRYEEALADFKNALELDPGYAPAYNNRGLVHYEWGMYEQALADFNRALELDPEHTFAYNNRGRVYYDQGMYDEALVEFNRAIELDPNYAPAYNGRGIIYYDRQMYDEALADFNRAVELDPDYAPAYNGRGNIYFDQGIYEQALSDYKRAIELAPDQALLYYNRAITYHAQGNYEQAFVDFDHTFELDPEYAPAYNGRGELHREQGNVEAALADYNRAIELDPNDALFYQNRASLFQDMEEWERALDDYNQAIELDPDNPDLYSMRGTLNALLRHYDQAIEDYRTYERLTGQLESYMLLLIRNIERLPTATPSP